MRHQDVALCTKIDAEGFTIKNLKVPGHAAENIALSILNNIPDGEKVLGITPENYSYWPYKVREQFILKCTYNLSTSKVALASKMKPAFVKVVLLDEGKNITSAMICSLGGRIAEEPSPTWTALHPDIVSEYKARNSLLRRVLASMTLKELNRVWKKCAGGASPEHFLYFCPITYLPLAMADIKSNPKKCWRYDYDHDTPVRYLSLIEKRFKEE